MSLWTRVSNVFRAGRVERELDEELQFHLEERTRELMAEGLTREAAARQAARRLGNRLRLREQSRDVKLMPWLDSLVRDVRMGLRMLRKNGAVTVVSVVSVALALGACLAAFSLIDALVLRPLPVKDPAQLVYLTFPTYTPERPESDTFNDPIFVRLRDAGRGRVDLFAMSTQVIRPVTFGGANDKERLRTQFVSGDAFDLLGVMPAAGRVIARQDDVVRAQPVAVVSHAFWTRRFGGSADVLGTQLVMNDRQFEIVGVAERKFTGIEPGRPTDVWFAYSSYNPRAFGNPQFNWFRILGRMQRGVRPEQAQSVLQAAFTNFRREFAPRMFGPSQSPASVARFIDTPMSLRSAANGPSPLRRQFERPLWILALIAGLILLIAGSNVANLFLARGAAREREMSLRLSIGASRGRLIQQVLVEGALVAIASCALGVLLARAAAPSVVVMLASADDPVQLDLRADWTLAAVAIGLTLVATALFGIAPGLRASGAEPLTALKTGGERSAPRGAMMRPFVALQVAFSVVVLFVGGLLVLSFAKLSHVNPGFASSDVLLFSVETVQRLEPNPQRTALLQVLERLRDVPGVRAVSSAEFNVLGRAWTAYVRMPRTQYDTIEATVAPVTPGYFETMRMPLVAGRVFVDRDLPPGSSTAVVVNEAFAKRYFSGAPAIGRTLEARFAEADGPHEVVGVVADARYDLREPPAPTIYIPLRLGTLGTIHVRGSGDLAALAFRLREEIRAANPVIRVTSVMAQSAAVDQTMLRERLLALLSGFFALTGLALVILGLYGVLSYSVVQRTREIGIRVALGARQLRVIRTVLAGTGAAALAGAAFGLAGALYLSRFVESLLFEVTPLDFWSLALPLGALLVAAALAAALPALRVARVDPVIALRYE